MLDASFSERSLSSPLSLSLPPGEGSKPLLLLPLPEPLVVLECEDAFELLLTTDQCCAAGSMLCQAHRLRRDVVLLPSELPESLDVFAEGVSRSELLCAS